MYYALKSIKKDYTKVRLKYVKQANCLINSWQGRRESNSHQKFWSAKRPPSASAPSTSIIQENRAFSQLLLINFNSHKIKNN